MVLPLGFAMAVQSVILQDTTLPGLVWITSDPALTVVFRQPIG